ncbi:hypothetical protein RR46_01051 [Papilio xuthus]|uniref:Uncharacterized protein n=1 Tax=Papilio xuthus TaxID=66420 RepID=A0A0N1IN88_PAPXU|nr:hypothetical protein RR46_01051 [Papilio xuthus]
MEEVTYLKHRARVPRLRGRGGRSRDRGRRRRRGHMVSRQRLRHRLQGWPHSRRHRHTSSSTYHLASTPSLLASSAAAAHLASPLGPGLHQLGYDAYELT